MDLERASLIGSCGELNSEFLRNAGRLCPVFLSWVLSSNFRGWVVSDLVGWSLFPPNFTVSHFGLWSFWPKSESDNVCIIMCAWMNRWAGVKFCEKTGQNEKGPFQD